MRSQRFKAAQTVTLTTAISRGMIIIIDPARGRFGRLKEGRWQMSRSEERRHDQRTANSRMLVGQKWRAGVALEAPSRVVRGPGGFAICCPQGESRSS